MNEEQKNIETCLAEDILSEVASLPQDPQFRSLTDEALDPLKQQAAAQAGYDGYIKVAGTHQPYTFTSQVKQMKSNLILLLRRLWRFPFGRGTTASSDAGSASASSAGSSAASAAGSTAASAAAPIRSLADMWQHYINRLKGNPEYGIPSRLDQLTDLPSAPLLVADRKISGVPEAEDGMSLVQLLMSSAREDITEITDDNVWGAYRNFDFISLFPNLAKLIIGCESVSGFTMFSGKTNLSHFALPHFKSFSYYEGIFHNSFTADTELEFPEWETIVFGSNFSPCMQGNKFKKFSAPKMKIVRSSGSNSPCFYDSPNLEEIDMPALEYCNHWNVTIRGGGLANNCPKLWKVRVGDLSYGTIYGTSGTSANGMGFPDCPKLIHLEVGANGKPVSVDMDMRWWEPTLDSSNLQQFLSNFKTYIAERLTDKGSGLTLTLSQEVRNAIHAAEDEYGIENIIITKKGWTISPAPN